jgi:hypothetical protein
MMMSMAPRGTRAHEDHAFLNARIGHFRHGNDAHARECAFFSTTALLGDAQTPAPTGYYADLDCRHLRDFRDANRRATPAERRRTSTTQPSAPLSLHRTTLRAQGFEIDRHN